MKPYLIPCVKLPRTSQKHHTMSATKKTKIASSGSIEGLTKLLNEYCWSTLYSIEEHAGGYRVRHERGGLMPVYQVQKVRNLFVLSYQS